MQTEFYERAVAQAEESWQHQLCFGDISHEIFKGRMCKHTPFLPRKTLYIDVRIDWLDQNDMTRTACDDDPFASSCIFLQCKHVAESGIAHVDPRVWFRKGFFGFWRVGDNHLIPYTQRRTQRRERRNLMNGWLDFHYSSDHARLFRWNHYCSPRTPVILPLAIADDFCIFSFIKKKNLQMGG